jgi:hypothetical protein
VKFSSTQTEDNREHDPNRQELQRGRRLAKKLQEADVIFHIVN